MKKLVLLVISLTSLVLSVKAQNYKEIKLNIPITIDSIYGTLLTPHAILKPNLVILIPGSGPTDRNGNQTTLKNNSLRYLAEALAEKEIAVYRYDKSIIHMLKKESFKEEDILFTSFIDEAKQIGHYFKNLKIYNKIIISGHSQGSLVGMIASKDLADAYISLAGVGNSIDVVLKEQLLKQLPQMDESITNTLNKLKKGEKDPDFDPMLVSIFRMSIQPFLIDWMQYNPQDEIEKLAVPVLVINGTKDLQISEAEAKLLHRANDNSSFVLIENMNHIFKEIKGDVVENQLSYMNPDLPIMDELVETILNFVQSIE